MHTIKRHLHYLPILLALITPSLAQRDRLWIDERITLRLITRWTPLELFTTLPHYQPHLPTYYLLPELAGTHIALAAGLLSLAPTTYATIRLAADRHDHYTAGLAGLLVATSPYLAVQAGWLRMYGLLTMTATFTLYYTLTDHRDRATITAVAAGFLHIFGVFSIIYTLSHQYHHRRLTRARALSLAAGLSPATILVGYKITMVRGGGLDQASTSVGHAITPGLLRIVMTPGASLLGSPHHWLQASIMLVVSALVVAGARDRELWAWVLVPLVGLVVASYVLHPVYRLKYYGMVAPAVAVLAASVRGKWERVVVGVSVGVLVVWSWLQVETVMIVSRRFQFWLG